MGLEVRHPVTLLGGDDTLTVLARGTLVDLGPAIVRVRLDGDDEPPRGGFPIVVVVHRAEPEMVLGDVIDGGSEPRTVVVSRVPSLD